MGRGLCSVCPCPLFSACLPRECWGAVVAPSLLPAEERGPSATSQRHRPSQEPQNQRTRWEQSNPGRGGTALLGVTWRLPSCPVLVHLAGGSKTRGLWCLTKCWCLYLKKSDPQSQPMGVHLHSVSSAPLASPCLSLLPVKILPRHPGSFCFPCVGKLLSPFHTSAHSDG